MCSGGNRCPNVQWAALTYHSGQGHNLVVPANSSALVKWYSFQTSAPSIFATSGPIAPPYSNAAGDNHLFIKKAGNYTFICKLIWPIGSYERAVSIGGSGPDDTTGATETDTMGPFAESNGSAIGQILATGGMGMRNFLTPGSQLTLTAVNQDSVNHTLVDAYLFVTWHGKSPPLQVIY